MLRFFKDLNTNLYDAHMILHVTLYICLRQSASARICELPSNCARQELLILSFLEPSTNGGSMNTDKVTQNLWSMGVDVRCCGDVFLLEVLGHMASPRHSRILYFKKLSSSVRRLKLCHAWTFQQQNIIQSTCTSKTSVPAPTANLRGELR